jgi:hypothetical protein
LIASGKYDVEPEEAAETTPVAVMAASAQVMV